MSSYRPVPRNYATECIVCGKPFMGTANARIRSPACVKARAKQYQADRASMEPPKAPISKECKGCGATFTPAPRGGNRVYCTPACAAEHRPPPKRIDAATLRRFIELRAKDTDPGQIERLLGIATLRQRRLARRNAAAIRRLTR